jgi:hypothetical protein
MCADVTFIANRHRMNLSLLSEYSDIWDLICWHASGNGVSCLSMISKQLRASTRKTPAYVFLAGRDADGFVVSWNDRSNILKPTAMFKGWIPDYHFRIRAESFAFVKERHSAVYDAVIQCSNHKLYSRGGSDMNDFEEPPCYAECFGCPSSPISQPRVRAAAALYAVDESFSKFSPRCYSPLIPALFPAEAHARAELYLSMNNSSSDCSDVSCSDESCSSPNSSDGV